MEKKKEVDIEKELDHEVDVYHISSDPTQNNEPKMSLLSEHIIILQIMEIVWVEYELFDILTHFPRVDIIWYIECIDGNGQKWEWSISKQGKISLVRDITLRVW